MKLRRNRCGKRQNDSALEVGGVGGWEWGGGEKMYDRVSPDGGGRWGWEWGERMYDHVSLAGGFGGWEGGSVERENARSCLTDQPEGGGGMVGWEVWSVERESARSCLTDQPEGGGGGGMVGWEGGVWRERECTIVSH